MGHKDLDSLYKIYDEIRRLNKKHGWDYNFKWDQGDFETRIDVDSDGDWYVGKGQRPLEGYEIFCPDLIDIKKHIIIEYEEEAKPSFGHRLKKGHFEELENPRDQVRNWYYNQAKFMFFQIYEHDMKSGSWKALLFTYLKKLRAADYKDIDV